MLFSNAKDIKDQWAGASETVKKTTQLRWKTQQIRLSAIPGVLAKVGVRKKDKSVGSYNSKKLYQLLKGSASHKSVSVTYNF